MNLRMLLHRAAYRPSWVVAATATAIILSIFVGGGLAAALGLPDAAARAAIVVPLGAFLVGLIVFALCYTPKSQQQLELSMAKARFTPRRHYHRAMVYLMRGRLDQSLKAFDRALSRDPGDIEARQGRAGALHRLRHDDEAISEIEAVLAVRRTPRALIIRGEILHMVGEHELALKDFAEAIGLDSDPKGEGWVAELLAGSAVLSLRRLDAAVWFLTVIIAKRPMPWFTQRLADAYRLRGDGEKAREAYAQAAEQARALIEHGPPLDTALAYPLAMLGERQEAAHVADRALKRVPRDPNALTAHAVIGLQLDDPEVVYAALRTLMETGQHFVVTALTDPMFTPLLTEERFRQLLTQAQQERDQMRVRVLEQIAAS